MPFVSSKLSEDLPAARKRLLKSKAKAVKDVFNFMAMGIFGKNGAQPALDLLTGKHPKTTKAWIKNGSFNDNFPTSVAKNPYIDESLKQLFFDLDSGSLDFNSYEKISSRPYARMLELATTIESNETRKKYENIIKNLTRENPSIGLISGTDKYHSECAFVFLSIINTYIDQEINISEKISTLWETDPEYKNGTINEDKIFKRTSSYFISILAEIFVNRWSISKSKFYILATGNENPESAAKTWRRWRKGNTKGSWFLYEKVFKNLSKDSRFSEKDHFDALLMAYKINLIFLIKIIKDNGQSVPEELFDITLQVDDIDLLFKGSIL